jgi:hypothetical protein
MALVTPVEMTPNQNFLKMVDARINGLRINDAKNVELHRAEVARADILSRMDDAEVTQYIKLTTVQLTPKEKAAAAEAERLAMEANRDKPSI